MQIIYSPVDPGVVSALRRSGQDAEGRAVAALVAEGGEYCRCCLGNAHPGERLLLASVDVGLPSDSPYRLVSPVFIHADEGCRLGPRGDYPSEWSGVRQAVRGYDARGWIVEATIHDGSDPVAVVTDVLARPGVVLVTSSNVVRGCHMFVARPA